MGVRGLTTYIYNNSNTFFDNFMLCNSDIVIDGNCLATILFYNSITNTASFGGDYDKYAKAVEQFFNELLKCNINPIVIFDGGYEKRKLLTVYNRNKNKVKSLHNIGPTNHTRVCFPLMMRQVFRDKLKQMNISFAQSDFEADSEIAALARKLQCPVLSNDSDFFIFDVTLIPINEFSLEADVRGDGQYYMKCLIYKVETFLQSLGGLSKKQLPLMAALLGNDYISSGTFENFYSQMKISRGKKLSQIQYKVQAIISWLKKESFESALNKILSHLKKNKQKQVATKVARIIQDYRQVSTPLDAYIVKEENLNCDIEILNAEDILKQYDSINDSLVFEESHSESSEVNEINNEVDSAENNSNETELKYDQTVSNINNPVDLRKVTCNSKNIPQWLLDCSRAGNIPSCIITLYSLKIYFCVPQVEEYEFAHAGSIGMPVLSKIAGILLGESTFSYYSRAHKTKFTSTKLPTITTHGIKKFPSVSTLHQLNISQRKSIFFDIFELEPELLDIVNYFPQEWHLFLYSLIHWARNIKDIHFQAHYFYAVALMIVCITVLESKIGYFRNKRPFMQRYASKIKKMNDKKSAVVINDMKQINDIIDSIPTEECLIAFEIFLPYFQIEEKLKTNAKLFSKVTVHAFAQFQVSIDLAYTLNFLLKTPFTCLPVHNFFNSTFLYNFASNLKKRTNIDAYFDTLFVKTPTILYLLKRIVEYFSCFITLNERPETIKKRKKRRKKVEISESLITDSKIDDDASSYSDSDNAFSVLSKLNK